MIGMLAQYESQQLHGALYLPHDNLLVGGLLRAKDNSSGRHLFTFTLYFYL
jgi:hypothetical protein